MHSAQKSIKRNLNLVIGAVICLVIIGFIFIYSSSSVYAMEHAQNAAFFVKKQAFGLLLGLVAALLLSFFPLRFIYCLTPVMFLGSLVLTLMTLIPQFSYRIHGSSRWLNLGGFVFQPSEMLKWALILYVAFLLARKEDLVRSPLRRYLPILFVLVLTSLVLLRQPDFGLAVALGATVICLFFIAYPDWKYVFGLGLSAIPLLGLLIYFEPYRVKRILTFLNPWHDPQGAGFQVIQSLIAVGSGGLFGIGISHSRQKFFYLPMQHTDFIFSIIAEETGFLGSAIVVFLYIFILYRGFRLSWQLSLPFARYVVQGFVLLVSIQAIINISVAVGLFPTKGIGLPFISYGNSALICGLVMVGILIACVRSESF